VFSKSTKNCTSSTILISYCKKYGFRFFCYLLGGGGVILQRYGCIELCIVLVFASERNLDKLIETIQLLIPIILDNLLRWGAEGICNSE
jgi:lipoate-protein ligase A